MKKPPLPKRLFSRIVTSLVMIWFYLPILGGIITPMIYLIPAFYSSWYLFGYNIDSGHWLSGYLIVSQTEKIFFYLFELTSLILGIYLLTAGIIHLAKARKNNVNIASSGPYKLIRHPQHLGIILISLPFALIIPFRDVGIRIADLLSILLNCTILLIISALEEIQMKQKFPEKYLVYLQETGFFFPKLRKKKEKLKEEYIVKTRKELFWLYLRIIILYLLGYVIVFISIFLVFNYTDWFSLIWVR